MDFVCKNHWNFCVFELLLLSRRLISIVTVFYRYCKCEMPYNPDDLMVQCEVCKDWYVQHTCKLLCDLVVGYSG